MKVLSCYNRLSKQSFVRFLSGAGPLATSSLALLLRGQENLSRSLRNSLNSSAVVSMVFQELCHLLAIFLDCSSSPCRSLLISKPTLCKTILSSSFVLESCTKTDKLFFFFGGIHFQNPGKNSEYYTCRPRFLSNCVISLVQQRHAYQV